MSKHILNTEDLLSFNTKIQLAAAFGNGNNKSLNIVSLINTEGEIYSYFTVERSKAEQIQTPSLKVAIDEYNNY